MSSSTLSMARDRATQPILALILSDIAARVAGWRKRHAWRHDLSRLDDHMLRDIGLSRADVEIEVAKPFWRV